MPLEKVGWLATGTADAGGIVSPTGERLVAAALTQEEQDKFNGVKPKKKKKVDEAKSYSNRSSKDDLEEYGRTVGIELDKRKSKKTLLAQLKAFVKK
jgi:hypothetical protein